MKSLLPLFLLAACSGGGAPDAKTDAKKPEAAPAPAPQELNVYIWTNYHSEEAVKRFEKENNVRVTFDLYDNNEVIEQKLQTGAAPYDVVVPTDYMVSSLVKQGLLLALDTAKLPNLQHIDPAVDTVFTAGEARYGVPYLWGTTGFAYRTDKVANPLDSWKALFDPAYKGKIVMLDDMREAFGAALHVDSKSINSTAEAEIAAAKKHLIAQKELVLAYDSSDFSGKIQSGDAVVVQGYSGELATVARESAGTIRYVVPKEGATLAVDNLAIPKAARNVEMAHKFINFMLDPQVSAETTNATGYATANLAARSKVKPELLNDPAVFPPSEILSRCEALKDLGAFTPQLDAAWTEVKAN